MSPMRQAALQSSPVLTIVVSVVLLIVAPTIAAAPGSAQHFGIPHQLVVVSREPGAGALPGTLIVPAGSSSGSVLATILPNYNGSINGNMPSTIGDWEIGVPALVPTTNTLWIPELPTERDGPPGPVGAPTVIYSPANNSFNGIVPNLLNASALVYDTGNHFLYATDPLTDSIEVFDPTNFTVVKGAIPVGVRPMALGYDSQNQYIFVANYGSHNVTVINGHSNTIVASGVQVGDSPSEIAVDASTGWVYVANRNSSFLSVIDAAAPTMVEPTIPLAWTPASGLCLSPSNNHLAVSFPNSQNATIVDTVSNAVLISPIRIGYGFESIQLTRSGGYFVFANQSGSSLRIVNTSTGLVSSEEPQVGIDPSPLALNPVNGDILAWSPVSRSLSIVDLSNNTSAGVSLSLGPIPAGLSSNAAAGVVYSSDSATHSVEILNPLTGRYITRPISLPSAPVSMTSDSQGGILYVGLVGEVVAYNELDDRIVATNALLPGPNGPLVADHASGILWVSRSGHGVVAALNLSTLKLDGNVTGLTLSSNDSQGMILDSSNSEIFAINSVSGLVTAFNGATGRIILPSISAGENLTSLAYDSKDRLVYAAGTNLTGINTTTGSVVGSSASLPMHSGSTGLIFDASRSLVYASTTSPISRLGTISVFGGRSRLGISGPVVTFSDGIGPSELITYAPKISNLNGSDLVLSANSGSGTIGLIGDRPSISHFALSPASVDLGESTTAEVFASGGAGESTVNYSNLPPGCATESALNLSCTPTASGVWDVQVTVTDSIGDTATASATLNVGSKIDLTATFGTTIGPEIDVNQTFVSTAFATGGSPAYTYSWTWGDGSTSSGSSVSHVYKLPGEYPVVVTATDEAGGTAMQSSSVQVFPDPESTPRALPSTETEVGVPIELNGNVTGGASAAIARWNFGPGDSVSGVEVLHAWDHAGTFQANFTYNDSSGLCANYSVVDDVGSCQNLTLLIHVRPKFTGTFSVLTATDNPVPGSTFDLSADLKGGQGPYSVVWSFGGGAFATGGNVTTSFARAGTYSIWANATDRLGGEVSFETNVTVNSPGSSGPSALGASFGPGLALGLFVGVTVAALILFSVERSRRRTLPAPPSPYVPPPASGPGKRN
jgi:YVTN family beta-propeller protein